MMPPPVTTTAGLPGQGSGPATPLLHQARFKRLF